MAGLFGKIRIAFLAKANELLDRTIDLNSPEAVKQYIRDLESAMRELNMQLAEMTGMLVTQQQKRDALKTQMAETDSDINLLLGDGDPSNDGAALELQEGLSKQEAELSELVELIGSSTQERDALQQAATVMSTKHDEMTDQLGRISVQAAAAKAKERAASALESANSAMSSVDGASVDNLADRVQQRNNAADARFAMAAGQMSTGTSTAEAVSKAKAAAAIQARLAKIQAAQSGAPAPANA